MKRISLSEVEVNDLLDLYQSEIDRAQRRINNLKNIVKKISEDHSIEPSEEKSAKVESKRGRKPKVKTPEIKIEKKITVEPKERGRKPKTKVEVIKAEPKKRGPKPKVKTPEIKVNEEIKKISKNATKDPKKAAKKEKITKVKAEPKKRGRKPKVIAVEVKVADEKKEVKVTKETKKPKAKVQKKKVVKVKAEPKKKVSKSSLLRKPIKGGKGKDKVKWNDFINETLADKDSLMLASSLTQAALAKFEIPASDRDRVRMAISSTLTKMANKDKVLQTYSQPGFRGAFFGLTSWFNDNADLKNEYLKKLM